MKKNILSTLIIVLIVSCLSYSQADKLMYDKLQRPSER